MRKKILFIWIFLPVLIFSKKITDVTDVKQPSDILITNQRIYIMDGPAVQVYDSSSGKRLLKFARPGEGPGEIKMNPFHTNTLSLHAGNICIDSLDKLVFFSQQGTFIKEIKKGRFLALETKPVAGHFAVKEIDRQDRKREFITLNIYNEKMIRIQEIARQPSNIQLNSVVLIPDSLHFTIHENRIYVEKSDQNRFLIEIYDADGRRLTSISRDLPLLGVKTSDKRIALNRYKNDPLVKQIGFNNLKKRVSFIYPKTFPPIGDILSSQEHIFVKTFHSVKNKNQFLVLSPEGDTIKEIYLPRTWEGGMISHLNGVKPRLYRFYRNSFYYLQENEEEEIWELHEIEF